MENVAFGSSGVHSRAVLSEEAVTMRVPSGEKAALF